MTDEATQAHKPTKPVLKGAPRQWIIEFTGDAVYANPVGMTTNDSFDSIQLLLQHGSFEVARFALYWRDWNKSARLLKRTLIIAPYRANL